MAGLSKYLNSIQVKLDDLLLDPNNTRFAELGQPPNAIPETKFADQRVQKNAMESMKNPRFDVKELRDTIKTMGFLPMDRIVVRRWSAGPRDNNKFVVVEGNRRVTALKWLLELSADSKETFTEEQIKNFTELEVLLLDELQAPATSKLVIPGLRHVSGIKEWGPYGEGRNIKPTMLREFIGGAILRAEEVRVTNKIDAGLLTPVVYAYWTTSDFHLDARKYARTMGMWYLNGIGLTQLALRVGLKLD